MRNKTNIGNNFRPFYRIFNQSARTKSKNDKKQFLYVYSHKIN